MPIFYASVSIGGELSPAEYFEQNLQQKGRRLTQPRRILVAHIFRQKEPFEAETLIEELSHPDRGSERVSRPTVYRTLNELVEAGLLRKVESD